MRWVGVDCRRSDQYSPCSCFSWIFSRAELVNILYREDIITADVSIENLVIRNLSTFDTKLAHLDLEQLALALELGIDDLRVSQSVSQPLYWSDLVRYI